MIFNSSDDLFDFIKDQNNLEKLSKNEEIELFNDVRTLISGLNKGKYESKDLEEIEYLETVLNFLNHTVELHEMRLLIRNKN